MPSSILNSDDGIISGTSGLKSTGGDDGVLKIQNNGVDAITVADDEDVPAGKPFAIVNAADLPQDYPQEAWTVSEADLTDGVGGESNEFQD